MNIQSLARRLACAVLLTCASAASHAQFVSGELLTASALNAALASPTITNGTITGLTAPLPVALGGTGHTSLAGLITLSDIAAQATDTVLANVTGSNHSPSAFSMPSCSTSSSALQYTSGTGFSCYSNAASTAISNSFTANQSIATSGAALTLNDTSGSAQSRVNLINSSVNTWGLVNQSSSNTFTLSRYVSGTLTDTPIVVANATGLVTMADGATFGAGASLSYSTPALIINDTSGANAATVAYQSGGSNIWLLQAQAGANGNFVVRRYSPAGTSVDIPLSISNTTGVVSAPDGLSSSGPITPDQVVGIVGTTTNNNAQVGSVGQYLCAQVTNGGSPSGCTTNSSTPVSLTNGTAANVTSISLGAGDWDVRGEIATAPGATTTISTVSGWISTASATIPTGASQGIPWVFLSLPFTAGQGTALSLAPVRLSLSTATTVYLSAFAGFGTSTMGAFGWISARRVR
jgi:hypothetical protein